MRRILILLLLSPLVLFSQDYKNVKGLEYKGQIIAPEGFDLCPGQIDKNGDCFLLSLSDTSGIGFLYRYQVNAKGINKLEGMNEIGHIQERDFVGQLSLSEDNQIMVFTTSFAEQRHNSELCISSFDARSNKYKSVRLLGELNDNEKEDVYPWLSLDGLRIYFTQNNEVYFSSREDVTHTFRYPGKLDLTFTDGTVGITSCWLTNDELSVYLTADQKVYKSVRSTRNEAFGDPVLVYSGFGDFISAFCISEKRKLAFVYFYGDLEEDGCLETDYGCLEEAILIYKLKK